MIGEVKTSYLKATEGRDLIAQREPSATDLIVPQNNSSTFVCASTRLYIILFPFTPSVV